MGRIHCRMEFEYGYKGERGPHPFPEKAEADQKNEKPGPCHVKCCDISHLAGQKHAPVQERDISGAKYFERH